MPKFLYGCLALAVWQCSCSIDDVGLLQVNTEAGTEESWFLRGEPHKEPEQGFRMPRSKREARQQMKEHQRMVKKAKAAAKREEAAAQQQAIRQRQEAVRAAQKEQKDARKEQRKEQRNARWQKHMDAVTDKRAEKREKKNAKQVTEELLEEKEEKEELQEETIDSSSSDGLTDEEAAAVSTSMFIPNEPSEQNETEEVDEEGVPAKAESLSKGTPVQMSTTQVPDDAGTYYAEVNGQTVKVDKDDNVIEDNQDYTLRDVAAVDEAADLEEDMVPGWQQAFRSGKIRTPDLDETMQATFDPSTISRQKDNRILRQNPGQFRNVHVEKTLTDRLLRRSVEKARKLPKTNDTESAGGCEDNPTLCQEPFNCNVEPLRPSEQDGWKHRIASVGLKGRIVNPRYFCKDFDQPFDKKTPEEISYLQYTQHCMAQEDDTPSLVQSAYQLQLHSGTADIHATYCIMEGFCQRMNHNFLALNSTGIEVMCDLQYGNTWRSFGLELFDIPRFVIQGKISKQRGITDKSASLAFGLKACATGSYSCDAHFCQQTYCKDERWMSKYEHLVEYEE